ncbi:MAG: methyltransferase domain-containing protein [Gemmataceae bacterium]
MRVLDRLLQNWRAKKAQRWIPSQARVLDIGCHQGEFLLSLKDRIGPSVGLDPLAVPRADGHIQLKAETFRQPMDFPPGAFDAVVMLATLEHIRDKKPLAEECARLLTPGGRLVITVPAKVVDRIVDVLVRLRLADGMSLDEHHGYDPTTTPDVFHPYGFRLEYHGRFQLGCNHLFVLRREPPQEQPNGSSASSNNHPESTTR